MSGISSSLVTFRRDIEICLSALAPKTSEQKIIEAAMRHFAEQGYHAARVGDIAA